METITVVLRQAREHKGVSLKEVEEKTRIPLKYLQALEGGGENGLLADEMYLIPFLRSYANFLGVDANGAVTRFLTELQQQDAATVAPPERRPPMIPAYSGPSRLASWIVPFLLLLVVLWAGPYLWQQGYLQGLVSQWRSPTNEEGLANEAEIPPSTATPSTTPTVVETPPTIVSPSPAPPENNPVVSAAPSRSDSVAQGVVTPPPSVAPATPPVVVASSQQGGTTGATPTTQGSTATPTPPDAAPVIAAPSSATEALPAGKHRLSVQATAQTWMRVIIDSQPGKEMILKPGESRQWTAESGFTLSLGNAGGVTLNLDGQELPPAGKSGQVVKNMQLPAPQ